MGHNYRCCRCGTEREDRGDVIWTPEGWLCTFCQDADAIGEMVVAGHPHDDAKRIVALMRADET